MSPGGWLSSDLLLYSELLVYLSGAFVYGFIANHLHRNHRRRSWLEGIDRWGGRRNVLFEQVAGLVTGRLQRGAGEFGRAGRPREPEDGAACVRIPVRRAEPRERRNQIDPRVALRATRQAFGIRGMLDDPETVPQPLDGRAGDEDRPFEAVGRLPVELVGDRGQQPVTGLYDFAARVQHDEGAGPVNVELRIPGLDTKKKAIVGHLAEPAAPEQRMVE